MKKFLILSSIFALLLLTACSAMEANKQGILEFSDRSLPLEEHTVDFSIKEAAELGYYCEENTIRADDIYYNEDLFLEFYEATQKKQPAAIRIFMQYDGNDPNHTGYTLYESERKEPPDCFISEIVFDGKTYVAKVWYPKENCIDCTYSLPYLNHTISEEARGNSIYREEYFLCEDPDITYDQIMDAMASSSSNVYRPENFPLRSVWRGKVSWEDIEKEASEPYLISAEDAEKKTTAELADLALSDRYVVAHYFEYLDNGLPMRDLVDAAIAEHPYLGVCLSRTNLLKTFGDREVWHMEDYTDWDQVLEELYRTYLSDS